MSGELEGQAAKEATKPRRWTWGWLWLTLLCLVGQPLAVYVVAATFHPGWAGVLSAVTAMYTLVEFAMGPYAVALGVEAAWTAVFGLTAEQAFEFCCATKDEIVAFTGMMLAPLAVPSGAMSCLLIVRLVVGRWFPLRLASAIILVLSGIAHALVWYVAWWAGALCTAMNCR